MHSCSLSPPPPPLVQISLHQTTTQLRKWVGRHIGKPTAAFRLVHVDTSEAELESGHVLPTLMRTGSKYLFSYNMKDGDQIEVQLLQW